MAGEFIAMIAFGVFMVCAMLGAIFGSSSSSRVSPRRRR